MVDGIGLAVALNGDCHAAEVDRLALEQGLRSHGEDFFQHVTEHCPHLFAAAAFFVSTSQVEQMCSVIAAIEAVTRLSGWQLRQASFSQAVPGNESGKTKGVFMGYDFHVNAGGAHLIEINTNAGGAYLNALLLDSQRGVALPGTSVASDTDLGRVFLDMFREEWRLERGDAPL
ncbi:MAG: hypothetical protein OEV35_05815, partial [Gallionellaceae bacterium]|nr:hypothetical protein [Gallionellaceae bacterium]